MDSEDASEATEVTTARGRRRRRRGRGRLAREMIVPEKKMMLPPPSVRVRRRISSERAGQGGQVGWRASVECWEGLLNKEEAILLASHSLSWFVNASLPGRYASEISWVARATQHSACTHS